MYINSSLAKVEALEGRLRRGRPAARRRLGVGVHRREHLRRPGRRDHHPADVGRRRAGGHHPGLGARPSPRTSATRSRTEALIRTDLYIADEAFLTGTAAEVVPIRAVDDRAVGTGRPGPVTKQIQETYFATVRGEVDRYKDWLEHVE